MPCGENKPPKSKIRGSCRETPRTGRSDGWRAKAKKEKVRLWKRGKGCARATPGGWRADPIPPPPSNRPSPPLSLWKGKGMRHVRQRRDRRLLAASHGRSGATGSPFRRNGVTVPAQRHRRSGATPSPFRRNAITVPAQRGHRSGATASTIPHAAAKRRRKTTPRAPGRNEKAGK